MFVLTFVSIVMSADSWNPANEDDTKKMQEIFDFEDYVVDSFMADYYASGSSKEDMDKLTDSFFGDYSGDSKDYATSQAGSMSGMEDYNFEDRVRTKIHQKIVGRSENANLGPNQREFFKTLFERAGVKGIDKDRIKFGDGLEWKGRKLTNEKGVYLDFGKDMLPSSIREVDFSKNELKIRLDTQLLGDSSKERELVFQGKGTINKQGSFVSPDRKSGPYGIYTYPEINLLYGEGGKITLKEDESIELLGGADLKVGSDFYSQFYSENSKFYKPEEGGDEEAVFRISEVGDSPSNKRFIPEARNAIVSVMSQDGETRLGKFYTSRRQFVKIINSAEAYFDPSYAGTFPFNPATEPFIEINNLGDKKIDVKIVGDYYMGYIPNDDISINNMYLQGKGDLINVEGESKPVGQYIYVKNGGFLTSVRNQETWVAGHSTAAAVSIGEMQNGNDNNFNNVLSVNVNGEVSTKGGAPIVVSTNPNPDDWNPSERLTDLIGTVQEKMERAFDFKGDNPWVEVPLEVIGPGESPDSSESPSETPTTIPSGDGVKSIDSGGSDSGIPVLDILKDPEELKQQKLDEYNEDYKSKYGKYPKDDAQAVYTPYGYGTVNIG